MKINTDKYYQVTPRWLWKALDDHGKYMPCSCWRCNALRFISPMVIGAYTLIKRLEV